MDDKEIKSVLESLLFIAGEPLTIETLKKILDINKEEIEGVVRELISEYSLRNSGLLIVEVAEGVQMVTNPASAPWVKKLIATAIPTKLSQQSLETLSIIAYKQPIIKSEIEAVRGVNSDGVIKTLLERRLVKILGRKEVPGRPLMYATTKEFLQYFGLKDLSELPMLKDFEDTEGLMLPFHEDPDEGSGFSHESEEGIEADESESMPVASDDEGEKVTVEAQAESEPSESFE
ncbi:MAG: SMC-Scp complex subunit ScpB [Thermodesulfovibrionia bacterium]|nr:SMC-Scp complex subunit ScpB [Thermodesulfovibrionia bacterium]